MPAKYIPPSDRDCLHCGERFSPNPQQVARGLGEFCSRHCALLHRLRHNRVARTCPHCDGAYTVKLSRAERGLGVYCSAKCYHDAARGGPSNRPQPLRVPRTCPVCGIAFSVTPSIAAKPGRGQYCSRPCANRAMRRNFYQDRDRGRYKRWRLAVIRRDGGRCQRCGVLPTSAHAHHIKHWRTHPELRFTVSNGETLCPACHGALHPNVPVIAHLAPPSVVLPLEGQE